MRNAKRCTQRCSRACARSARRRDGQFQAVDLRWGVSEDAGFDQRTVAICLDEVDRSSAMIVLLGDRYGWRPLPDRVDAVAFEAIRDHVDGRLDRWYRRDDNAVPPEYRLQSRTQVTDDEWTAIERELRGLLTMGAQAAGLPDAERRRLAASATELEILRGALDRADVHCYFRSIDGLPGDSVFGERDQDARMALERIKRELAERHASRTRHYTARWTDNGPTQNHLPQLCEDVFADLSAALHGHLNAPRTSEPDEHAAFGRARARWFVGRQPELDRIKAYVANPCGVPLAIIGPSGGGKSALLARAIEDLPPATLSVTRFVGATVASTTGGGLLSSVCHEIAGGYGQDETAIPTDYRQLTDNFSSYLAMATPERPLVVAIDALDQFGEDDPARDLAWLPLELPANAAVIVSSTESLTATPTVLELEPMTLNDGAELLDRWLSDTGRILRRSQRNHVLAAFRRSGLPLHLRLLAEEARRWPSYANPPAIESDVSGVVRGLFARLSKPAEHGEDLVQRSLGYLVAAKHGLSEDELLEVLSDDTEAMDAFRRRFPRSPVVDELPPIIWSRLGSDLAPYLMERSVDGTALLDFFHRQMREVTEEQFLADGTRVQRHQTLARYFGGQPLDFEGPANLRKLSEQPYQETFGELWEDLFATLTDFVFLERKVADAEQEDGVTTPHSGVYLLQEDYRRALRLWPR